MVSAEAAYAGVVYLHSVDSSGTIHVSLIMSKSKVAPIRRLTEPRLELCGANLLAGLLNHVQEIFEIPSSQVFAWTDSTVLLGWLSGNPRRFKTFVGNRVSNILELIPPDHWRHVSGVDNPADSPSRGMFPSELLQHENGPTWLSSPDAEWPEQPNLLQSTDHTEEKGVCLHTSTADATESALPMAEKYSSFTKLKRVTAWIS